ncbi:ABC transporter substrate-binding protein [Streptomyces sp. NBC_01718]|uniref:ABC transporter substrate-binding protein n=1 Tax=unclassified Streptomyces TaxID=2593676 RepID=UPI0030DEDCFE
MNRRKWLAGIAALSVVMLSGACSTESKAPGKTVDTLKLTVGPIQSFQRNWNPFAAVPDPTVYFFYEPLLNMSSRQSAPAPWLAKSWKFSDGGKTLTFKLQSGVKWSDGKPFTADDVKYSLEIPLKNPQLNLSVPKYSAVEAPDATTVVVRYPEVAYTDLTGFSGRKMYPRHIWSDKNLKTYTNPQPVGTGPVEVGTFSPQQIQLRTRADYWNGAIPHVKKIDIVAAQEESARRLLLKKQLDWATMSWQGAKKDFVGVDPEHNHYMVYPLLGSEGVMFNTKKGPTTDVHLRRALTLAIDTKKVLAVMGTDQPQVNPAGLSDPIARDWLPASIAGKITQQDAAAAKSELAAGGWTVKNGKLTKAGKTHPLSLDVYQPYTNWVSMGAALRDQWKAVLGIDVTVNNLPDATFNQREPVGDFTMMTEFLTGGNGDPYKTLSPFSSSDYKPLGDNAAANFGRFDNATYNKLVKQIAVTDPVDTQKRNKLVGQALEILVDEAPFLPVAASASFTDVNSTHWSGWPTPDNAKYTPVTYPAGPDTTLTLQHLVPTR